MKYLLIFHTLSARQKYWLILLFVLEYNIKLLSSKVKNQVVIQHLKIVPLFTEDNF